MTNKRPTEFLSFSVSVSMPKLELERDTLKMKRYYFKEPETDQSNVCGSEVGFNLTGWRDSATADIGCHYVFGVKSNHEKSSTSDEHYKFAEPKGEFLHWSQAKDVLTSNEFSDSKNCLFRYNKCSQNEKKHLQHLQSGKYLSINDDHQIVLTEDEESAGDITITYQTSEK